MQQISGHVYNVSRARTVWYAKYRLPSGRQVQKKIGPAWTGRGRPPAGYFTKRTAEDWLRSVLDEADGGDGFRCRGRVAALLRARSRGQGIDAE